MKQALPTLGILICLSLSLSAQITISPQGGNRYRYKVNTPTIQAMENLKSSQKPGWGYFWEFGDGYFSYEPSPIHSYEASGSYDVRVYLTPQYAKNQPTLFRKAHQAAKGPSSRGDAGNMGSKYVDIMYNQEVVAGKEVQMLIAYKVPPNAGDVYLLLGYNDLEGGSVTANAFAPVGGHRPPQLAGKVSPAAVYGAPLAGNKSTIQSQLKGYNDIQAFKLAGAQTGDQRGVAVSLRATPSLRAQSNKNISVKLKAMLVSTGAAFDARRFASETQIRVTNSYDPNKLIVFDKTTEYDPEAPEPLDYLVKFENVGRGDAQRVQIGISVEEGLDPKSLKILDAKPCFTCVDTVLKADSIYFVMEGVRLAGRATTGFFNKGQRQGQIRYQLTPKGDERDLIRSEASIVFDINDPIETGRVRTRLRRNGIGFKAGVGLRPSFASSNGQKPNDQSGGIFSYWHAGLVFSSSPIRTGLAWEFEMTYNAFNDTFIDDIEEENITLRKTSEFQDVCPQVGDLRISNPSYVDLVGQLRYHYNNLIGIGVGVGPSLLFNSRVSADLGNAAEAFNELKYGLINIPDVSDAFDVEYNSPSGDRATCSYDHNQLPHSNVGGLLVLDGRIGKVNKGLSLGLRVTQRVHFGDMSGASGVSANYFQTYLMWKL